MNLVKRFAFRNSLPAINQILSVSLIVLVSNLVSCTSAFAVDKIKCVVDDFHYGIWMVDKVDRGHLLVDEVTSRSNPEVTDKPDKPVLEALGKELSKKLDGTAKFEVETRDAADLAPGEKFKAASALLHAELSCTGTGPNKRSTLSIDARLVRMDNSEIVDVAQSSASIEGGITWPKSLEEYSSTDFQKSATAQALQSTLDQIATELSQKAPSILKRLNPVLNKQVPTRHSGK